MNSLSRNDLDVALETMKPYRLTEVQQREVLTDVAEKARNDARFDAYTATHESCATVKNKEISQ